MDVGLRLSCFILPILSLAAAVEAGQQVGDLGAPGHLVIRGAETFPAEDIRSQLRQVPSVQVASWQSASLAEYLDTLRARTVQGYRRSGFADVEVNVELDEPAHRIVVTIREGARYLARGVKITGVPRQIRQHIVSRLTRTHNPNGSANSDVDRQEWRALRWVDYTGAKTDPEKAIWIKGKPAKFNKSKLAKFRERVGKALDESGYDRVKFELSTGQSMTLWLASEPWNG